VGNVSTRKVTAREAAYKELRHRIVSLKLPPGSPLSENELAEHLSVSRTPVRESLILLAEEGLVQVFPQLGTFVSRVDTEKVADAQFVREAIEVASLKDAVRDRSDDDIARLRDNLAAQSEPDLSMDDFFELDEKFHQALLTAGGHAAAWRSVESAKAHLDRARRLGLRDTRPHSTPLSSTPSKRRTSRLPNLPCAIIFALCSPTWNASSRPARTSSRKGTSGRLDASSRPGETYRQPRAGATSRSSDSMT
jgi:GntR family transcriptional regulator, rspAB operon transcriptional repressor